MNKLNIRLKELRYEKRIHQKDVAKFLNISESTYAGYEQGRSEPNINTIIKLAHFFDVSVGYIVGDED